MNCFSGKTIKEEPSDIRTVVIGGETQKIVLTPRVEIHRVIKTAPDEHMLDQHPPPQVIFTTSASRAILQQHQQPQHSASPHAEPQPLQRVQVIKDGRCFYAEESLSVTPSSRGHSAVSVQHHSPQHKDNNGQEALQLHHHQRAPYPSSPPPLLVHNHHHHHHHQSDAKNHGGRQINVISNGLPSDEDGCDSPVPVNGMLTSSNGSGSVFRPPVVSSSSTPMRPPPPPPPPRSKGSASEEPSSSIPDLGE